MHIKLLFLYLLLIFSQSSHAYIGPGLGVGMLTTVAGIILSLFVAIFAVTYYPIKRALKRRKVAKDSVRLGTDVENTVDETKECDQD